MAFQENAEWAIGTDPFGDGALSKVMAFDAEE